MAKAQWVLGDYQQIADRQAPIAEQLCEAAGVGAGERVLDLATATGNVALAAARRGARVTGLDLTPGMLEMARHRAEQEQLDVEWVEGDLEDLPFQPGAFDVVLSSCGMWIPPRPAVVVRQMRGVLGPDGRLGIANYGSESYFGQVKQIMARHLPAPEDLPDPMEWGVADIAVARLQPHFRDIAAEVRRLPWSFPTAAAAAAFLADHSPPHVAARDALGPARFRTVLAEIEAYTSEAAGGREPIELQVEYLVVTARAR